MTDELMIQPQVQPRKQANPLVYGTVGALAGAGAGALVNQTEFIKGKKIGSVQDIINDANSKDKAEFSTKYASTPEEARTKLMAEAAEVKRLKDEIKNLPSKTLPADAQEAKDFEAVKKEKQEAFDKLVKERSEYLEKHGGTTGTNKSFKDLKNWEDLTEKQRAQMILDFDGEKKAKKAYGDIIRDLKRADNKFENSPDITKLTNKRNRATNAVNGYFTGIETKVAGKTPEEITEFFDKKRRLGSATDQFFLANEKALQIIPDKVTINDLTLDEILEFADKLEDGDKRNPRFEQHTVRIPGEKPIRVQYMDKDLQNALKVANKGLEDEREKIADDIMETAKKHFIDKYHENNFMSYYLEQAECKSDIVAKQIDSGLYDKSTNQLSARSMNQIVNENSKAYVTYGRSGVPQTGYKGDIKVLQWAVDNKKTIDEARAHFKIASSLNGNYGTTDPIKALDMAEARKILAEDYKQTKNNLADQIKKSSAKLSYIQDIEKEISDAKALDTNIKDVRQKAIDEFSSVFTESEGGSKLSESEIKSQAEKWAENNLDSKLKTKFNDLKSKYDKAVESKGVANGEAKAALESKLATAESNVTKFAEEMCTKGGKSKLLAPIIGGIALGLAGLGIANSKNS